MNHIYRVVWNESLGVWQAVAEHARSRGKTKSKRLRSLALAVALAFGGGALAADLPTGGTITAGSGSIHQNGAHLTVNQGSGKLAIDWQSFSIGKHNSVTFNQPSASAVALNRVLGPDVSVIQGALNANGQVFLINPNGVLFTPTAQVDVGGLVASTLNMSTEDFLAGNYAFEGDSAGSIVNQGSITAAQGGTVALIAARVENSGSITAHGGNVLLGSGSKVTLDLGGPVKLEVEEGAIEALIKNGGAIKADGGTILLTAKAAEDLASTVINNDGIIEAQTLTTGERGEIVLLGENGTVEVAGTVDVSAPEGQGGKAVVTGERVLIADGARINATGAQGGGEIYVGGGWQGEDPAIKQATATVVMQGATLDASATDNGNGGTVVAWSDVRKADSITRVAGELKARGGANSGDGGSIETSGHSLEVGSAPDVSAAQGQGGKWLIDPYNITVVEGSVRTNINNDSPFASTGDSAELGIDLIDAALKNGEVVIQTAGPTGDGEQGGDITWNVEYAYTGGVARTLTLNAHRDIILNESIRSVDGALSMNFNADFDDSGAGGTVVRKDLESMGGAIRFGGLGTIFSGESAQKINTSSGASGGALHFYGEVLLANPEGLTITTSGGNVDFDRVLDAGNRYTYDGTLRSWVDAKAAVESGAGDAVGSTYLATITSALENTAAMAAAAGREAWLGGSDAGVEGTWRWVTGPEGMEDGGQGRVFHNGSTQGLSGYVGANGSFVNWNRGEPNNSGDEDALQLGAGAQGQWNDLSTTSASLGSIVETNLAASPLIIDAGAGRVTFGDRVGAGKALASLNVTASEIVINGDSVRTEGAQTYNGNVEFGSLQQFVNPSFEDGLKGWTIVNDRIYFSGHNGSTIGGFETPVDTTYPDWVVSGCSTAAGVNCDTTPLSNTWSFTTKTSSDVAPGSGTQSLVMNSSGSCTEGFCIVRGPYVISDSTVTLPEGGMVSFKWQAKGGGDAYDVYGYLLNTATGKVQTILDDTGASQYTQQPWTTASVSVDEPGTYKFVFVSGTWDATGGRVAGAQLYIDDIKAAGGAKAIDAAQVTFNGTVEAADNQLTVQADKIDFHDAFSGTGRLTLQQRTDSHAIEIGGAANHAADTLDITGAELALLQDGFKSITIGSSTGTGSTTVVGASQFTDDVTLRSGTGGIALHDSVTATAGNTLTLDTTGTATQTSAGSITADGLALRGAGGTHRLDTAANEVDMLAADTGSVTFVSTGALTIGSVGKTEGINATGKIHVDTPTGDLTIARDVNTSDASDDAIVLNAGRDAGVGDTTGGNVLVSGGVTVEAGAGGRAILYTGGVAGSTGVTNLVGSGSGRFRYNSDESSTNYDKALESGLYAIYREAPTVTIRTNNHSKVYDGQAYTGAGGITTIGLHNGDQLNAGTYSGGGIDVGTYTLSYSTTDSGVGYAVTYDNSGTLTVTPRPVNVSANAVTKTYGDADPALSYAVETASGGRGLLAGDTLDGALSRAAGEDAGAYAINVGTLANGNYSINYAGANFTIAKRAITLAADAVSKIYGEADPTLSVRITGGSLGSETVSDALSDVVGMLSRAAGENVGAYDVALGTGAKAANYDISFDTDNNALTITPRPVDVTAIAANKTYGDADPALSYVVETQSVGRGLLAGDALGGALDRVAGEDVGTYAIGQGTLADGNYSINFTGAELTIAKRAITLAADAVSKIYGEADPTFSISIVGGSLGSETVSDALADVVGALSRAAGENVGAYDVALGTGAKAGNYDITFDADNDALTITPRPVDVIANAATKTYGEADVLTYTTEAQTAGRGLLAGDTLSGSLDRAAGEDVGTYAIGHGTLENVNYSINFTGANLTITPRPVTVTANNRQKMQGTSDPALTYVAEGQSAGRGLVHGDSLAGLLSRASGEGLGDYAIGAGSLTDANNPNYVITFKDGVFRIVAATEVETSQHVAQVLPENITQGHDTVPQGDPASFGDQGSGPQTQGGGLRFVDAPADEPSNVGSGSDAGGTPGAGDSGLANAGETTGGASDPGPQSGSIASSDGGVNNADGSASAASTAESGESGNEDAGPDGQFDVAERSDLGPLTVLVVKGGIKLPSFDRQ